MVFCEEVFLYREISLLNAREKDASLPIFLLVSVPMQVFDFARNVKSTSRANLHSAEELGNV